MVGLEHLVEKLDDEDGQWDRTLSGGEQQRLAFARLFLHKPDIVVMDEATSALDPESQAMLMEKLAERLPKTAIISVGHRPELEAFHERKVNLVRREGGAKLVPGEVVGAAGQHPVDADEALARAARGVAGDADRDGHRGAASAAQGGMTPAQCTQCARARRRHSASDSRRAGPARRSRPRSARRTSRAGAGERMARAGRDRRGPPRRSRRGSPRASAAESRARSICGRQSFIASPQAAAQQGAPHPLARRVVFALRSFRRAGRFRAPSGLPAAGDDLRACRSSANSRSTSPSACAAASVRSGPGAPSSARAATSARSSRRQLAPRAAPVIVADAAHHAREERQQRHARRPWARPVEHAHDRLVQHVGPAEPAGQPAAPQPRQRLQADQVGVRQRMKRARRVDGVWSTVTTMPRMRSKKRSMPIDSMRARRAARGQAGQIFFRCPDAASPGRILIRSTNDGRGHEWTIWRGCAAGTRRTAAADAGPAQSCRWSRPSPPCRAKISSGPGPWRILPDSRPGRAVRDARRRAALALS